MEDKLRKLQLTQLEILKKIDCICRKWGIQYSLYAGTLLGAVRHKGFIPWDDDLDICMSRAEYNKFISVWNEEEHAGYILQNKENEPAFPLSFTKIRKDHTTFLQTKNEAGAYHTGIFVDIFPVDRMPEGRLSFMIYKLEVMLYQLYTREFVPPKAGKTTKLVSKILLRCIPVEKRQKTREKLLKRITSNDENRDLHTATIETMETLRIKFPANMLDSYTTLKFEDAEFMCFLDWDEHLKCKFGDYMKLPPEEERTWKHHPLAIDFEHNYNECVKEI